MTDDLPEELAFHLEELKQERLALGDTEAQADRFALAAIGILALGIGMSVAMFSLVDAVLIRPLPFPGQELIRVIWKADPLAGPHVEELAYPELRDLQQNIAEFEYAAVMPTSLYGYGQVLQVDGAEPVEIAAGRYSGASLRVS